MIHEFELWSAQRTETSNLSDLSGCVIAIEADFYLERVLNVSAREPLLSALGGTPFSFRPHVEDDLAALHQNDVKPVFVFGGLRVGKNYAPFAHDNAVASLNAEAWALYGEHKAAEAVSNFGSSGYATPRRYYPLLQKILREREVDFQVAPYSALGQLAYLSKYAKDYVDIIAGSSELLLFDIDRVITSIDYANANVTAITRQSCLDEIGVNHADLFTDACMLSGCSMLPPLPSLPPARTSKLQQLAGLLKSSGVSVYSFIEKDHRNVDSDYLNRYKRSRLAVKHDIVLTLDGKVEPLAAEEIPNDLHDIIGQRLPDELYYYLFMGAMGPRMLNQLTSSRIYEDCPADGGESETYKSLVSERLTPMRTLSLALLAFRLHRAYNHRMIELTTWYAPDNPMQINVNERGDPLAPIREWRILENSNSKSLIFTDPNVTLTSTIKAVHDLSKPLKINTTNEKLQSIAEVKTNVLLRFMFFGQYVDSKLSLTTWGKVLWAICDALPDSASNPGETADSVLLAAELLKLDLLTSDTMFPHYTGAPMHGSLTDKANTLLLARVACLGKLHHKDIGFTGPLSRHLLAYGCLVDAVRTNVRDLIEMSLVSLLLSGHATRDRQDFADIAKELPLQLPLDCALGIAMKHYLDDVNKAGSNGTITTEIRDQAMENGPRDLFPHVVDFEADMRKAFHLWDAVS